MLLDYKRLYLEEQRQRKEEQRRREAAEERTRKTTLPELLHECHLHFSLGLNLQTNPKLGSQGRPDRKVRPEHIRPWVDFGKEYTPIWANLVSSSLMHQHLFTTKHTLQETGEDLTQRMLGSAMDLTVYHRIAVEDPVAAIVSQLCEDRTFRETFNLAECENHGDDPDPENVSQDDHEQTHLLKPPRRSLRLQARRAPPHDVRPATRSTSLTKTIRPRAHQFCAYNIVLSSRGESHRVPAFVIEYKAQVTLGCIYEGLEEMDLDEVVQSQGNDDAKTRCRLLMAALITQTFSHMMEAGLRYGLVCTGEAYIFLRVGKDPRTVYYFLSVPKGDVGAETGWTPTLDGHNRLHLTAVGQMLAFTLLALRSKPRDQQWRDRAQAQLQTWAVVDKEILEQTPSTIRDTSEYQPPPDHGYFRSSPIQLRRQQQAGCSVPVHQGTSDSESGPDCPSRSEQQSVPQQSESSSRAGKRPSAPQAAPQRHRDPEQDYCTQSCLLGLLQGGALDQACPNVVDHGQDDHQIDQPTFLRLMGEQLARSLDHDVHCPHVHGSRGVFFRVRLSSHGYVVAAKGTPPWFEHYIRHEAAVYQRLRPIQGRYVPVHLGVVDLVRPYHYDGIADLDYMMFMSFGGSSLSSCGEDKASLIQKAEQSLAAVHGLGVLHGDVAPRNLLWSLKDERVIVIDFDRAEIDPQRSNNPNASLPKTRFLNEKRAVARGLRALK